MFIKDSYLLAASQTFDLEDMQEITVNIDLIKAAPCYHTLLIGKVYNKKVPVRNALVMIFDSNCKPLFRTMTNSRGVYRFYNIPPGIYKIIVSADSYHTTGTRNIKIKENKITRKSFHLKKCPLFSNGILYGKVKEVGSKKPIEGASIYLKDSCGTIYKTTSNRDGQYIIYNIHPKKYKLIAVKQNYASSGPFEFTINKNERNMFDIDLIGQCNHYFRTIHGTVTYDNRPVPNVPVFLYQLTKEGHETIRMVRVTNKDGVFLFSNLAEGTYRLKGKLQSAGTFEKKISLAKQNNR